MPGYPVAFCLSFLVLHLGSAVTLEDGMPESPVRRQHQSRKGVSVSDASSDSGADWVSSEFAPTTSAEKRHKLMTHGMTRRVLKYERHHGWDCKMAKDALSVTAQVAISVCKETCDKDLRCSCMQFDRVSKTCYTGNMTQCNEKKCSRSSAVDMYLQRAQWSRDTKRLVRHQGKVCSNGVGSITLPDKAPLKSMALLECQDHCAKDADCTCFKYGRARGECTKMKQCDLPYCETSAVHDTYMHEAAFNGYAHDYEGAAW